MHAHHAPDIHVFVLQAPDARGAFVTVDVLVADDEMPRGDGFPKYPADEHEVAVLEDRNRASLFELGRLVDYQVLADSGLNGTQHRPGYTGDGSWRMIKSPPAR